MATYYKYQKRDEGAQIDWATIGKNISDGLFEEVKVREQKKEKIQKDTNEAITFLNQYELGSSQSANQFIMNSSAQARDYLSMQNKLLKQGLLKPSDYNLGMQTLKDDYTQLSTAMKNFNTTYSEALGNLNDPSKKASNHIHLKKEKLDFEYCLRSLAYSGFYLFAHLCLWWQCKAYHLQDLLLWFY